MTTLASEPKNNKSFLMNGFTVHARTTVNGAAKEFETNLLTQPRRHPLDESTVEKVEISLTQQTLWLENTSHRYVLFQLQTAEGLPAGQLVAYLYQSKKLSMFGHAVVPQVSTSFVSHEAELAAYLAAKEYLSKISFVCRLRVQAMRVNHRDLLDFEALARRAGFHLADPVGVTRTLVYDLNGTTDELLATLDKKTRAKVRHIGREKVDIRPLNKDSDIEALQNALNASFARSQGLQGYLDFDTFLKIARNHPERALILGLYLKSRPTELMAYLINIRHDTHIEAVSAGSLGDPELRKLHFNYFLFWDRVLWAMQYSKTFLDMGGVTDGGSTDPLAGISAFKRHFTKKEIEIGREMEFEFSPLKNFIFKVLKKIMSKKG